MSITGNVRLYGPLWGAADGAAIELKRDAVSVEITSTDWVRGPDILTIYVDLNDPEDGSSLDLHGTPADFRTLRDSLTRAIDEAEEVPVEERR